jgi:TRAP-type C4-dicarboxylate transport system permease small subunit
MKIIHHLSRWFAYVATGVLGLMMLLTVADVFMRAFFNSPITGTTEITEFMMIVVVFPALAWCAVNRRHVRVDLLVSQLPPRIQTIIDSITLLLTLCTFIIITWHSMLEAMDVYTTTSLLKLPHAPFYWVLTAGLALFCLSIVTLLIENIMKEVKR